MPAGHNGTEHGLPEMDDRRELEAAVRGIASAGKALKLYPPTSPIPRQSVETAANALSQFLGIHPVLSLAVTREGFAWLGESIASGVAGVADLADALRDHGVAEIDFTPGCTAEDLIAFLDVITHDTESVRAEGGAGTALVSRGVEGVRVTDVQLTVLEEIAPAPDEDIDEFLRQLALDPDKLATWMAAASAGDPAAFREGLTGLAEAVGPEGNDRLLQSLAEAFLRQNPDGKDALLGLAFEEGTVRELARGMFGRLGDTDIATSLTDGLFGKNMLSLSNALTSLPLQQRIQQVHAQVQAALAAGGHLDKETTFLSHMLDVRQRTTPEPALVDADTVYRKIEQASMIPAHELDQLREQTEKAREMMNEAGVNTMLVLLDQQKDFHLYCRSLDALAAMVPKLIDQGDLALALKVLREISARESRSVQPWPELTERLREATAKAVSERSMAGLLRAATGDATTLPLAREIARVAGDAAGPVLTREAITLKDEGIAAAEEILGRRLVDLLAAELGRAQWFQLAPAVARLARENDPRAWHAIEAAAKRPDEQSRREVATGLARSCGANSAQLLGRLARDPNGEVAIIAIRSLGQCSATGAATTLGARFDELDVDGKDYPIAREIIGALARVPDPAADQVLGRIAARKALIKRGHFAEIQDLAGKAAAVRSQRGGAR